MDCAFHRPKSRPLNCSCLCVGQSTKANRGNPRRPIRPTIQHAWRQATARPLHGLVCGAVWPSVSAVFESDSDQNAVSCWGQKRRESRLGIAFTGSGGHFGAKGIVQKRMKVLSPFNFAFVEMPSRLIDRAVDQIAGLPGVGRRTALRLALHLLGRNAGVAFCLLSIHMCHQSSSKAAHHPSRSADGTKGRPTLPRARHDCPFGGHLRSHP